jgi:hypothetical protein
MENFEPFHIELFCKDIHSREVATGPRHACRELVFHHVGSYSDDRNRCGSVLGCLNAELAKYDDHMTFCATSSLTSAGPLDVPLGKPVEQMAAASTPTLCFICSFLIAETLTCLSAPSPFRPLSWANID